ncbi:unnamed protein product [Orchesella dallaii]|uniref:Diphthine--ammonia ligase n=1 Tax=Orchesella dallaii TaxID=48710 RepID=A0ABP1R011_9HEXA
MRVVALISGGKDSCYNMMMCVAAGHEIVALANLQPAGCDEMDSYMYQTVGHDGISLYSQSMGLPLYRRTISGQAVIQDKEYSPTDGDEVEDLYSLLMEVKADIAFEGVAVGAILSDYQRVRVESVCSRLGLISLAYLWRRSQTELLQEMVDCGLNAILIKTASLGLDPDLHLGQTIAEMQPHLLKSKEKYGINVCGEGGEYETFTLDCPLFQKSIVLDEYEKVIHSADAFAPVGYLKLNKLHLVTKTVSLVREEPLEVDDLETISEDERLMEQKDRLVGHPVKCPDDFVSDLIECNKAVCCDCDGRMDCCAVENSGENNGSVSQSQERHCKIHCSARRKGKVVNGESSSEGESSAMDPNVEEVSFGKMCQTVHTKESQPFLVEPRITSNSGGWLWVVGIEAKKDNTIETGDCDAGASQNPMTNALMSLKSILEERGFAFSDTISICMYVGDMNDYPEYNKEYIKFFASRPPVRVCIEAPLPSNTAILLEALAYRTLPDGDGNIRNCMHVQGISHWAPANIGPYSQAVWVGDIIYIAGQIALVPGSMLLLDGGARMECRLALRHLDRILRAVDPKVEIRDIVQGICFVTDENYIEECRQELEKRTNNSIVEYLVVPRLPRDARVEWQIWAHKHNTAFEYEETGCYFGSDSVKVKIIRRWNYENRIAAIVCRASIVNEGSNLTIDILREVIEYALRKLLKEADKSAECFLRVFYRANTLIPSELLEVLESESTKYSVAYCILPVSSLVLQNTVMSVCGVRHQ